MSRTILIPDIHLKFHKIEPILTTQTFDRVVFLGDFFDDFYDNPTKNAQMAQKLNEWMTNDNFDFCFGNHDCQYIWLNNLKARCSGYGFDKGQVINNILDLKMARKRFRWHHVVDGWLLTHAGLHPRFINTNFTDVNEINNWLNKESIIANNLLDKGQRPWFIEAGQARGGDYPAGGIIWCDAHEEFEPINGVKQVFGHTFCGTDHPLWIDDNNICLDTGTNHYAVIEDGKIEIHKL